MRATRVRQLGVVLTLFAVALSAACAKPAQVEARKGTVAVGETAPRFSLLSLSGDSLVVADTNNNVTLLNVWATWCTSCKEEFSELERLRSDFSASGLRVVGVSVDQGSDVKVRKFVETQGAQFAVAHDAEANISALYGINGLPTTFLLDGKGKVLWRAIGDFRLDSAGLAQAIEASLVK